MVKSGFTLFFNSTLNIIELKMNVLITVKMLFPISNEKKNIMITYMNTWLKTGLDVLNILNFGFNSYISVSTIVGDANSNIIKNTKVVRVLNLLFHSYVTCGLINYTYSL